MPRFGSADRRRGEPGGHPARAAVPAAQAEPGRRRRGDVLGDGHPQAHPRRRCARCPRSWPGAPASWPVVAVVIVVVPLVAGPGTTLEYTAALIYGIIAISLVVLTGWSGNVSLGQFAFAGVGGVLAGDLIEKANVDLFLGLAAAGVGGCGAGGDRGHPRPAHPGRLPGRGDAGARRGDGHLLLEPDLLPEHHPAGLPAPGALAALRPGLEQGRTTSCASASWC